MADNQPAPEPGPVPGIRPPPPVCLDSNISENWRYFKQRWHNYAVITNLSNQSHSYQVALLLHVLGEQALKIYNGFTFDSTEANRTVDEILQKFDDFAIGDVNETYERYVFHSRYQSEGESFESFLSVLRTLIRSCRYCDNCLESVLRDRIVLGIRDTTTQQLLLRERGLTLAKTIDICKTAEAATTQSKAYRAEAVNKVQTTQQKPYKRNTPVPNRVQPCKFCGTQHVRIKEKCPAWGKTCRSCSKPNHFAKMCHQTSRGKTYTPKHHQSKPVHGVDDTESDESAEWVNALHSQQADRNVKCEMLIAAKPVTFQIDTGASVNLLPERNVPKTSLISPTSKQLTMWNGTKLIPVGVCRVRLKNPGNRKNYSVEFVVVREDLMPLIGLSAAQQMRLVTINEHNLHRVATVALTDDFADVFDENIGTLQGEVHLRTDGSVVPTVAPARRIPIAVKPKLEEELNRLVTQGVIAPVEEPTPWVNQIVITQKKSGELRICLDPRELNKALMRERYTLPVLDDVLHELKDSRVFTKADLSAGYWHVMLDYESSLLTTFQTCFGRYRFLRLPFGTSVSSEIFQKKLLEALDGLDNVLCIADDVIIHSKNHEEHDRHLKNFLLRCRDKGIKLNKEKLELRMPEISFMGHRITDKGLQTDPEKVRAVNDMDAPRNVEELRRFLGMINYLGRFLPNVTTVTEPLHNLIRRDTPWTWSEVQQKAFDEVKKMLTQAPILAFYDVNKPLTLENDASEYGLGTAIFQEGRPIAYASRTLTDAERRHAQIEKEALALVYGLEKFHQYTYGRHVNVVTDHKPLVAIVSKPLSKAPKRLQSLILRTQKYDFSLTFQPGKSIVTADTLSRAPVQHGTLPEPEVTTVNNISLSSISQTRLDEIRAATDHDEALQLLKQVILQGWPAHKSSVPAVIAVYFDYRDELTVQDGILLRSQRVIIPSSMRRELVQKVHAGHMGINSCLRRARELIFWPGMSTQIRQFVQSCPVCATYSDKQQQETLWRHEIPHRPWQKVGTDLFEIKGRHYLVTVDYLSQFFEVDYLPDTTSQTVVTKLKHHFARHGIPDVVISDGGPQYTSSEFIKFSKQWSFKHEVTSPGNSKANGAAEAAVKVAKNMMRRCNLNHEDPYLGLLNLRNTPTEGWQTSPAQRLFGRRTKTLLPTTSVCLAPNEKSGIETDRIKASNKRIEDTAHKNVHRKDLPPLQSGATVQVQPIKPHQREWKPGVVIRPLSSRTYEVQMNDGSTLRRNRQFLRSSPTVQHEVDNAPDTTDIAPTTPTNRPEVCQQEPASTSHNGHRTPQPSSSTSDVDNQETLPKTVDCGVHTRSGRLSKPVTRLNL